MPARRCPLRLEFFGDPDCIRHAALQRVVRVDQENAVIRKRARIRAKSLKFGAKRLDPAVGVRAFCRHAEQGCAEHIRGGVGASDIGGAAGAQGAIGSLGAAQAEFDDGAVIGRFPYPGCFGGDERLEINVTEEDRLDHLAFDQSAADLQERFIGEDDGSFGNRSDVAAEPKI